MEAVAPLRNGVNVDTLIGTIDAVKADADIAKFEFRAKTEWIDGGHCKTEIKNFFGAKTKDTSRTQTFVLEGDEPAVLLGSNQGVNAVEAVLHALASCLSVGFIYNAAALGITVESLVFYTEGKLDLHAFLGLSDTKRAGYESIQVTYDVKADAPRAKLEELCS